MNPLASPPIQAGPSTQAGYSEKSGWVWRKRSLYPIYLVLAWLVLVACARLIELIPFPLPLCSFRVLTGLPCAFCGSTRCFVAWSHLEIAQAFRFNPLVASSCVGLIVWALLRLWDVWFGSCWSVRVCRCFGRKGWLLLALVALANWVYLILYLPN